jgi:hypothetical protein
MPRSNGLRGLVLAAIAIVAMGVGVRAADRAGGDTGGMPPPVWPTSPYHGVISGATGEAIPCRCRFRGGEYRLGDTVCMTTHLGVQLARCDLFLNNTSWVPLGVPCTMSRVPARLAAW